MELTLGFVHFADLGVILYLAWVSINNGELVGSFCAVSGSGSGRLGLFWKIFQAVAPIRGHSF